MAQQCVGRTLTNNKKKEVRMSKGRKHRYLEQKRNELWVVVHQDLFDWDEPQIVVSEPLPYNDAIAKLNDILTNKKPQLVDYFLQ